jgi:hypothetical protein
MGSLFLDPATIHEIDESLERVRVLIRRAERWTTKAESKGGMEAHRALHDAEEEIKKAIKALAR